jgi:diguanylate cyclase (GGDEF)-like protein
MLPEEKAVGRVLGIENDNDVKKLLTIFDINNDDLEHIKELGKFLPPDKFKEGIAVVYEFVKHLSEIAGYYACTGAEDISFYFHELLKGNYDYSYCLRRFQVGIKHDNVGIKPVVILSAYNAWVSWVIEWIIGNFPASHVVSSIKALGKITCFDRSLLIGAYVTKRELNLEEKRKQVLDLNRMLRVTYSINQLIVRATDLSELFNEAVRILVKEGEFALAWIGMIEDETKQVIPVASYGMIDYLDGIKISVDPKIPEGMGPTGTAAREGTVQVVIAIDEDPRFLPWKENARRFGIKSCVALPIRSDQKVEAVLNVYSTRKNQFLQDEVALLQSVADDLGYAIAHLHKVKKLEYVAFYDALTGVCKPTLFEKYLDGIIAFEGSRVMVVCLDIDNFTIINRTMGIHTGDHGLVELAKRLERFCGYKERVGRIGGDEFIVAYEVGKWQNPVEVVQELRNVITTPFALGCSSLSLTATMGISVFPDDGSNAQDLIHKAKIALLEAKRAGKGTIVFYSREYEEKLKKALELEIQLKEAIEKRQFVLFLQPKIDISTRSPVGFEALIRWNHPEEGLLLPGSFISILEESGLIVEVGWWVIEECLRLLRQSQIFLNHEFSLAFNISASQFEEKDFISRFLNLVGKSGIDPSRLELEITESLLIRDTPKTISDLKKIAEVGVKICIDDFGTGYSSFKYLKDIPAYMLKIDYSFVKGLPEDESSVEIVKAIVGAAHGLRKKTIAEGVERKDQLLFLASIGVNEVQGFYFAKPMPEHETMQWIKEYDPKRYF